MSGYFIETPTRECDKCGQRGCVTSLCMSCETASWRERGLCHDCGGFVFKGAKQCSLCREDEDLDVAIGEVFHNRNFSTDPRVMRQQLSREPAFSGMTGNRVLRGEE